jgi:hypothetical protein
MSQAKSLNRTQLEAAYSKTSNRLQKIQAHLQSAPRTGRLRDKVCIITGVGSLKGIGYAPTTSCLRS